MEVPKCADIINSSKIEMLFNILIKYNFLFSLCFMNYFKIDPWNIVKINLYELRVFANETKVKMYVYTIYEKVFIINLAYFFLAFSLSLH